MKRFSFFLILFVFALSINTSLAERVKVETLDGPLDHTVIKGDTLWDITEEYLDNPMSWPEIWKQNPQIENPHLIYPGDKVRFSSKGIVIVRETGEEVVVMDVVPDVEEIEETIVDAEEEIVEAVEVELETEDIEESLIEEEIEEEEVVEDEAMRVVKLKPTAEEEFDISTLTVKKLTKEEATVKLQWKIEGAFLNKSGFITKEEADMAGYVVRSKEGHDIMSQYDVVYVAFDRTKDIKAGNKYSIVEVGEEFRHPITKKLLGNKIKKLGVIKIKHVGEEVLEGRISKSYREILAGSKLIPYIEPIDSVTVKASAFDTAGFIVESYNMEEEMANTQFVHIDQGFESGLEEGTLLNVFRIEGDVYDMINRKKAKIPNKFIGQLVVVDPRKYASTAIVVNSTESMNIGDIFKTATKLPQ